MAATASVRRALTREAVEAQVAYLVLAGLGEDGRDDFAVAFLLRCRANGFMIAVPNVTRIREFIEGLLMEDGEPLALVQREQVQAETVRARHLGPSHILLLDLPWSALEHVVPPQALRGIRDRAGRHSEPTLLGRRSGCRRSLGGPTGPRDCPGVLRQRTGGGGGSRGRGARCW